MKMKRLTKLLVAGGALVFLSAISMLADAQSAPPAPVPTPRKTPRPIRTKKEPGPMDDFAGLTFTDDQKARISKIHEDIKGRMDAVIKDDKLSPEQKGAMLQGFQHMERGEVYKVLTADQQAEVRKRILARRAEDKKQQEKNQPAAIPQPTPTQQPSPSSKPPLA